MYPVKNCNDDGMTPPAHIGFALLYQQRTGHCRTMDDGTVNNEISATFGRSIGNGSAMYLKRAFRHDEAEFCRHQMLQHCSKILCSRILRLALLSLLKQLIQIRANRFGGIRRKHKRLVTEIFFYLLRPKRFNNRKLNSFFRIPRIEKINILNHNAHASPAGSAALRG